MSSPGPPIVPVLESRLPDADRIAALVLACPRVAGLHRGRFGEVATYLPGRRVTGIRITPNEVLVHLVGRYSATITEIDASVRAALHGHTLGLPVTIVIEDLALPGDVAPTDQVRSGPVPLSARRDALHEETLS